MFITRHPFLRTEYECKRRPAVLSSSAFPSHLLSPLFFPNFFFLPSRDLLSFFPISPTLLPLLTSLQCLPFLLSLFSSSPASYDGLLFSFPDGLATSLQDTSNGYSICRNEIIPTHAEVPFADGCGLDIFGRDCRHRSAMEWLQSSTSHKYVPGCDEAVDKIFSLLGTQRPPHTYSPVIGSATSSTSIPYPPTDHVVPTLDIIGGNAPRLSWHSPWPHPEPSSTVTDQHYHMPPPPLTGAADMSMRREGQAAKASRDTSKLRLGSVVNLASGLLPVNIPSVFDDSRAPFHSHGTTLLNQGAALYDQISSNFDILMTAIDRDHYEGLEASYGTPDTSTSTPIASTGASCREGACSHSRCTTPGTVASIISRNYFAKVDYYANSKLPLNLPPMKLYNIQGLPRILHLYFPNKCHAGGSKALSRFTSQLTVPIRYLASYQLLSLAAKYSDRAYLQPQGAERFTHIGADWRAGTKAMVIKSVPMDDANIIVFAIRGTSNFMDWAVNLNMAPTSPAGFLDDPGNLCHAGFLSVARKMIRPVAVRLRQFLEEDPSRASYSLLITGHSAGGAVASLLYAHMVASSTQAASELNLLTGCFRRVHCITFGAPPISLLPLKKPERRDLAKSLFFSFVNEGDPVARADRQYIKSLIGLFSTSTPKPKRSTSVKTVATNASKSASPTHNTLELITSINTAESGKFSRYTRPSGPPHGLSEGERCSNDGHRKCRSDRVCLTDCPRPIWNVPPSTLSNAGRIVVLRSGNPRSKPGGKRTVEEVLRQGVVAQFTSDEQLRGVVWGDPLCHAMRLYAGRIETLAVSSMMVGF